MSGRWRWRLQASWRVGDEAHSYRPYFVDSEEDAEKARLEMIETLWHFRDLIITVDRVDEATADAEEQRIMADAKPAQAWVSEDLKRTD
jgi:hypothetical protein